LVEEAEVGANQIAEALLVTLVVLVEVQAVVVLEQPLELLVQVVKVMQELVGLVLVMKALAAVALVVRAIVMVLAALEV
jgi:hypothetical protein